MRSTGACNTARSTFGPLIIKGACLPRVKDVRYASLSAGSMSNRPCCTHTSRGIRDEYYQHQGVNRTGRGVARQKQASASEPSCSAFCISRARHLAAPPRPACRADSGSGRDTMRCHRTLPVGRGGAGLPTAVNSPFCQGDGYLARGFATTEGRGGVGWGVPLTSSAVRPSHIFSIHADRGRY